MRANRIYFLLFLFILCAISSQASITVHDTYTTTQDYFSFISYDTDKFVCAFKDASSDKVVGSYQVSPSGLISNLDTEIFVVSGIALNFNYDIFHIADERFGIITPFISSSNPIQHVNLSYSTDTFYDVQTNFTGSAFSNYPHIEKIDADTFLQIAPAGAITHSVVNGLLWSNITVDSQSFKATTGRTFTTIVKEYVSSKIFAVSYGTTVGLDYDCTVSTIEVENDGTITLVDEQSFFTQQDSSADCSISKNANTEFYVLSYRGNLTTIKITDDGSIGNIISVNLNGTRTQTQMVNFKQDYFVGSAVEINGFPNSDTFLKVYRMLTNGSLINYTRYNIDGVTSYVNTRILCLSDYCIFGTEDYFKSFSYSDDFSVTLLPANPDDSSYLGFEVSFTGTPSKITHNWYMVSYAGSANGTNFENMSLFVSNEETGSFDTLYRDRFVISPASTTALDYWMAGVVLEYGGVPTEEIFSEKTLIGTEGDIVCLTSDDCPTGYTCSNSLCVVSAGGGGGGGGGAIVSEALSEEPAEQCEYLLGFKVCEALKEEKLNCIEFFGKFICLDIEKKVCKIDVKPEVIALNDDVKLVKVTLVNNEPFDYEPAVKFGGDLGSRVNVRTLIPVVPANHTRPSDFGVAYTGNYLLQAEQGTATMILGSEECEDITVPITIDIKKPLSIWEILWNFLIYPISSRLACFVGWMLLLLVAFGVWKANPQKETENLPIKIIVWLIATGVITFFFNTILEFLLDNFIKDYTLVKFTFNAFNVISIVFYLMGIIISIIALLFLYPAFAKIKKSRVYAWLGYSLFAVLLINVFVRLNIYLSLIFGTLVSTLISYLLFVKQATRKKDKYLKTQLLIIGVELLIFVINLCMR